MCALATVGASPSVDSLAQIAFTILLTTTESQSTDVHARSLVRCGSEYRMP